MEHRTIDGARVPTIGFGTWQLEGEACVEGVRHALEIGYRHLDTAQVYENEGEVGRGIETSGLSRDELFITTKIWRDNLHSPAVRRTTEASLRRLGTGRVDLLLIHWPNPDVPLAGTLEAMMELREEGKTRHIGVSNFPPSLFREAVAEAPVACHQVEYHPYLDQTAVLEAAREHDVLVTAYSPLARGKVASDPVLAEIGEAHGRSPAQVALRWLVQQEGVAAIPKAASADHREANLDVFSFELSDAEMERVHGLARGERLIDPEFAPDWTD